MPKDLREIAKGLTIREAEEIISLIKSHQGDLRNSLYEYLDIAKLGNTLSDQNYERYLSVSWEDPETEFIVRVVFGRNSITVGVNDWDYEKDVPYSEYSEASLESAKRFYANHVFPGVCHCEEAREEQAKERNPTPSYVKGNGEIPVANTQDTDPNEPPF